ncbi:MAG: LAGLIDADG family homing endonuclease [Steroidobacteraceae bacterium]|nr:LAGLIDADG family homing endonuclease [Steroidobacteraceae bacterium]
MQPRRTARLSTTDAAYLAGLIDGEGSISLTRVHRGQNRQLALSISNTERALLERVLNATKVGKITTKRTSSPHHAPGLTYTVANRQALDLLVQVTLFLKSYKAERAQLVIDHYVRLTPRNGKYSNALRVERCEFESRFAAISMRRRRPGPGDCVREAARPWPAGDSPARTLAGQLPCIDFTYSATACS